MTHPLHITSFQADKGNQVQAQPQAFFLPLGEGEGGPVIDLEVSGETEETDLQRALRQRRPDYIAAFWNVVNWDAVAKRYAAAK